MKKVIKPSKQPTKKQSQRRQRSVRNTNTAKLKKAIGKIAAQLVKDHPKLVKGGGSSGITDLIFNKKLMKGGEIGDNLRDDIVKFLKDSAPKVNKLKKDLLIKIIDYFIVNEKAVTDDSVSIVNINEDFNKGVYEYKDNYKEPFKEHLIDKQDIYDDFIILEIVKKFYILSKINVDNIPEEISNVKFEKLPDEFISALNSYDHSDAAKTVEFKKNIVGLLDKYKDGKGENEVEEEGKVLVVAKKAGEKNIEFELNIRIDAAIQAAIAANNEIEEIKNALDKKTAAEAVTAAATAALTKAKEAAAAVTEAALTKAKEAAVIAAKAGEDVATEVDTKAAGDEAVIAAIAALSAIYAADNNDGIEKIENVEEEKVEDAVAVIESSKNKATNLLAVNEILKIMTIKPSPEQDKKALEVVLKKKFEGESIDKTLARAAATVAADSVEGTTEEQKSTAITHLIDNRMYAGGKPAPKYKSTGQVVNIMYKKRKYKRTIFVKEKRKTKYCKINNEYILLSKLNVL